MILKKQEMTRFWVDGKFMAVTLLKIVPQEIIWFRTVDKDGYSAVILWADKKELNKDKGIKVKYGMVCEFEIDESFVASNEIWKVLDAVALDQIQQFAITWTSKWKGFQWVVRRFHFAGWPETHGSKFHRRPGSIWNRKPRRVNKWKKLPWHMWLETVTLKNVKIIDKLNVNSDQIVAVKWSIPGAYNSYVKAVL